VQEELAAQAVVLEAQGPVGDSAAELAAEDLVVQAADLVRAAPEAEVVASAEAVEPGPAVRVVAASEAAPVLEALD
jgi:hypothetical protein